ncbi:MAG: hypothetical protein JWO77_1815 [Ilumatobacteraceae bacterium]|nr:hypothetical protein [Ilumatobacteraceae bacterium]
MAGGPAPVSTIHTAGSGVVSRMADHLRSGSRVAWNTPQGETEGKVIRKLIEPCNIEGHHVAASDDDPQYLVESDATGARAAHRPEALRRL